MNWLDSITASCAHSSHQALILRLKVAACTNVEGCLLSICVPTRDVLPLATCPEGLVKTSHHAHMSISEISSDPTAGGCIATAHARHCGAQSPMRHGRACFQHV